jgi:hypothetical protein
MKTVSINQVNPRELIYRPTSRKTFGCYIDEVEDALDVYELFKTYLTPREETVLRLHFGLRL